MEHIKGERRINKFHKSVYMIMHGFKLLINEKIMKMKEACISFTRGRIPLILHPQYRTGARLANILDCHKVSIPILVLTGSFL
jgi:hypothetical protein